jgi:hypothetical protein
MLPPRRPGSIAVSNADAGAEPARSSSGGAVRLAAHRAKSISAFCVRRFAETSAETAPRLLPVVFARPSHGTFFVDAETLKGAGNT